MRLRWYAAATLSIALSLAACGVSTGEQSFELIPDEEVPFGLEATSTTTSTTTTTMPEVPDSTVPPTTTTPIRQDPAEFYFLSRGRLQPVVQELQAGFTPDQVADILEEGPPPGQALDTLVEDGLILSSTESRGMLTIDLDTATFTRIPSTKQTEAIGQIVMTMLRSLRGVGFVNFTLAGEPIAVKKGNSLLSEVGEPLAYDDYVVLLASPPLPTDPSATTTTMEPVTGTTDAEPVPD